MKVVKEEVDIEKAAADIAVHSDGELKRLDVRKKIAHRWLRATTILSLSAFAISAILIVSILILGLSADEASRDWARQTLTALMGSRQAQSGHRVRKLQRIPSNRRLVKRSTPQAKIDDRGYPVRMLILVPEEGFGTLLGVGPGSIRHWLDMKHPIKNKERPLR